MATVTYPNDVSFDSAALPTKMRVKMPVDQFETVVRRTSEMDDDDAVALRLVSAIIFTVVALGTLAMLATVLVCG